MDMNIYRTIDIKKGTVRMRGNYVEFSPRNDKEAGIMRILNRYGITIKKDITHKADRNCYWIGKAKGNSTTAGIKLWDISVPFLSRGLNRLLSRGVISEETCGRIICSIIYLVNVNKLEKSAEILV